MAKVVLNRAEQKQIDVYFELLQRYQNLPVGKMLPWVAVRCLCLRKGYDKVMDACRRYPEQTVASFARDELRETARLWARMVRDDPPPQHAFADVMAGIQTMWDGARDATVYQRINEILIRCHIREDWMRQKSRVH